VAERATERSFERNGKEVRRERAESKPELFCQANRPIRRTGEKADAECDSGGGMATKREKKKRNRGENTPTNEEKFTL